MLKLNLAQLISWNVVNAFWSLLYILKVCNTQGTWFEKAVDTFRLVISICLYLTLLRLGKIMAYMDPENDSERKVRSQLKFNTMVRVIYCVLGLGFYAWEASYRKTKLGD